MIFILYPFVSVYGQQQEYNIKSLLPAEGEISDWKPDDDPQYAFGDDLYVLINGGAEIYHEYGFVETIFQSYLSPDDKSINLEIYKMESPAAAYGMYTFKTGSEGVPVNVGNDGWLESYYINFWRGNNLITVIGLDTDSLTIAGIQLIASIVDSKLELKSDKPRITSYLHADNLQNNGITYLKGHLALYNQYMFDTQDLFGIREGVAGRYDDHTLYLIEYENQIEAAKRFASATQRISQIKRFKDVNLQDAQIEFVDAKNNKLIIRKFQRWIIITLSDDKTDTDKYIIRQQEHLSD
jgi:hypothetical protein